MCADLLIRGGLLIDPMGGFPVPRPADVLIRGGRVVHISQDQQQPAPPEVKVINLGSSFSRLKCRPHLRFRCSMPPAAS